MFDFTPVKLAELKIVLKTFCSHPAFMLKVHSHVVHFSITKHKLNSWSLKGVELSTQHLKHVHAMQSRSIMRRSLVLNNNNNKKVLSRVQSVACSDLSDRSEFRMPSG